MPPPPTLPTPSMLNSPAARGLLWVSPWLIGFAVFMLLPVGLGLYYSFTEYTLLEPPIWIGLDNYRNLLRDDVFWLCVRNTVVYGVLAVPLGTIAALAIAGLLNQPVRGRAFFRAAVFVPSLVPLVACAMIWLWLFNGDLGLVNRVLALVGLPGPNWLLSKGWALPAMVIISVWLIGNSVVIYLAAMQDVPRHLYEAGELDGLGPLGRFRHITLPSISPVILFNVVWSIIVQSQIFATPYVMTQGGPDRATYFYTMYLYDNAFVYSKMGYASAIAWVQFVLILGLTGVTFWASRKLVHYR